MIATFSFLIKTCLLLAVFAFLLGLGGTVTFEFESYSASMAIGPFILCLCLCAWFFSIIYRGVSIIINAPQSIARYNEKRHQKKGLQALAYGLSAVAAGDVRAASHYTQRLLKYLKGEDYGLSDLMTAFTAKLKGDDTQVRRSFHALMLHKETSFLGLKGLLQNAIVKKDYRYARLLAEKAYRDHPNQPWIIKTLYDLEVKTNRFEQALPLLKKMEKLNIMDREDIRDDRSVLLLGMDQAEKAYKQAPHSLPVGINILRHWADQKKRRKSLNLIKTLWTQNPHPDLLDYWIKYAPKKKAQTQDGLTTWIEELYNHNKTDASSALYCGEALIAIGQTDQAKRFVKQAIALHPTQRAYQAMGQCDPHSYSGWMDQNSNAPHDKCWVCSYTGQIYKDWQMACNDGLFNSLVWDYPDSIEIDRHCTSSPFLLAA